MKFFVYFLPILGLATMLEAAEGPSPASAVVTLISADEKEIKVPLELAENDLYFGKSWEALKKYGKIRLPISGEVLAEIVQLMRMLDQYKNLTEKEIIEKADTEISIADNYAFAVAVKYLSFQSGIDLISEKYKRSGDYSFPKEDYEYYMKLIQELDSRTYEKLRECESATGTQYLKITMDFLKQGVAEDAGAQCPTISINPALKLQDYDQRIRTLKSYIDPFNAFSSPSPFKFPVRPNERMYILEIIKELAPDLYTLFVANDPTGLKHIERHPSAAAIYASPYDGLPVIRVSSALVTLPEGALRYVLAHELSHYVLKHLVNAPAPSLRGVLVQQEQAAVEMEKRKRSSEEDEKEEIAKKVLKVTRQLPFEETFENAFSRVNELEADRLAVMGFGASIDGAIAYQKRSKARESVIYEPAKETFRSTHPLSPARIKQLEDLREEVALNKARGIKPKPIDWKALADFYLGFMH